jgi:hypothetical protein
MSSVYLFGHSNFNLAFRNANSHSRLNTAGDFYFTFSFFPELVISEVILKCNIAATYRANLKCVIGKSTIVRSLYLISLTTFTSRIHTRCKQHYTSLYLPDAQKY